MTARAIKLNLHKYIDNIKDEAFLKAVYTIVSAQAQIVAEDIENYASPGKPMTAKELKARVKKSKSSELIDHQKLKKEIENW
jgi:hypothetical protein